MFKKDEKKDREILPAEVTFDKAVYGGISYFAQAATGIMLLRWLKFGGGNHIFEKMAEWTGPKLYKGRSLAEAAKEVSSPLTVFLMVMVGNSFIAPVKWLESRKAKIVRAMDEKSVAHQEAKGHPLSEEEKAHHEKLLQQLEQEPKQTWGSLLSGRAAGLIPVFATSLAIGDARESEIRKKFATTIGKGAKFIGLKKLAKTPKFSHYSEMVFVDLFYSAIAASGLYIWTHLIKPPKKEAAPPDPGVTPTDPALSTATTLPEAITAEEETPEMQASTTFRDSIKPKEKMLAPEALHTQKLSAEASNAAATPGM